MICSEAKLAANRRNAQRSTGPRTAEGKAISRANALKHGLCASVLVPESAELVQQRAAEFFHSLKPQNLYHCWLVDQVAIGSVRVDRAQRIERRVRDKVALRAELTWDDDRRLEAETLGAMLPRKPAEVVETLRRSPFGCDWMMERWAMLARAADIRGGSWTEDQAEIAFDLLGTPRAFREGVKPGESIDLDGKVLESGDDPASVARRMVAELKEHREVVAGLDDVERVLTQADLTNDADAELRKLRRYEAALHKQIRWSVSQLKDPTPEHRTMPGLTPRWQEESEFAPRPEPRTAEEKAAENHPANSWQPPFCLEPDEYPEPGKKADIPAILSARKAKRIAKAEARREAHRKRIERLREG